MCPSAELTRGETERTDANGAKARARWIRVGTKGAEIEAVRLSERPLGLGRRPRSGIVRKRWLQLLGLADTANVVLESLAECRGQATMVITQISHPIGTDRR
jgi:hypothetical protein